MRKGPPENKRSHSDALPSRGASLQGLAEPAKYAGYSSVRLCPAPRAAGGIAPSMRIVYFRAGPKGGGSGNPPLIQV